MRNPELFCLPFLFAGQACGLRECKPAISKCALPTPDRNGMNFFFLPGSIVNSPIAFLNWVFSSEAANFHDSPETRPTTMPPLPTR